MSHLKELSTLKEVCENTGNCTEYNTYSTSLANQYDTSASNAINSTLAWSSIGILIGILVVLTPFIKPIRSAQSKLLPALTIATPIIVGGLVSFLGGAVITFSNCYKQDCTVIEGGAWIYLPALSLLLTVPIARKLFRRRDNLKQKVQDSDKKPTVWLILGFLIILSTSIFTYQRIQTINAAYTSIKANQLGR